MADFIQLGPADAGTTRQVRVGDTIAFSVEENPTTGFLWHLKLRGDGALLVSDPGVPLAGQLGPEEGQSHIGQGRTRTFRLTTKEPGETELILSLRRPWEEGKPAFRSLTVHITVLP